MSNEDFLARIKALIEVHPPLKDRFESMLNIIENTSGQLITADDAEEKIIEEVAKLSNEVLKDWAIHQHDKAIDQATKTHPTAKNNKKKISTGKQHLGK